MNIKTVTVIGANGAMGMNISAIFASFGNAKVYMVARSLEAAKEAKKLAANSVKAKAIENNLIPMSYSNLEECISSSDLVFESVTEDMQIKKDIYNKIEKYIQPHAIIGTGTSGLSINELSKSFDADKRKNYMGIHMFNPPYNMTLCEVIPSAYTDTTVLNKIKIYLEEVLYRKVVETKDIPAFLGNRIGFQFINEAMQYAEEYKDSGGIDYIDSILGSFTGRSMAPLTTSDFVGLDVHQAIVDNIYRKTNDYAHETFLMPEFALKLIKENRLGRKTGAGLYKAVNQEDGTRTINVYDIATGKYRESKKYDMPFALAMKEELRIGNYKRAFDQLIDNDSLEAKISTQFLIKYGIYGLVTGRAIGESIHSADDAMATGFNWVPPLAIVDAFGGSEKFIELTKERLPKDVLEEVDVKELLQDNPKSNYDYRPFFKVK